MHDLAMNLLDGFVIGLFIALGLFVAWKTLIFIVGFILHVIVDWFIIPDLERQRKKSLKVETDEHGNKWKEI